MKEGGRSVRLAKVELCDISLMYLFNGTIEKVGEDPMVKSSKRPILSKTSFEVSPLSTGVSVVGPAIREETCGIPGLV